MHRNHSFIKSLFIYLLHAHMHICAPVRAHKKKHHDANMIEWWPHAMWRQYSECKIKTLHLQLHIFKGSKLYAMLT